MVVGGVAAIAVSGSDVYVGGAFTAAGAVSASRIAKWDGSSWSALGGGVSHNVLAIAVVGGDVYTGGFFDTADGTSASRIARWDGSSWSALGSGVNGVVRSVAISGSGLYVGGGFTTAGGKPSSYLGRYALNTPPTVDAGPDATIILGNLYSASGSFSDPDPNNWTATVDYGDGSGAQPLTLTDNTFTLDHVYATAGTGTFTVSVAIDDGDGGQGGDMLEVTVLTPQQGTSGLVPQIEDLVARGALNTGQSNALIASLNAAIRQLERGNVPAAINQLQAFIDQVSALVNGGILSPEDGQPLIAAANEIVAALGG